MRNLELKTTIKNQINELNCNIDGIKCASKRKISQQKILRLKPGEEIQWGKTKNRKHKRYMRNMAKSNICQKEKREKLDRSNI